MTSRSYRFKPALYAGDLIVASPEGRVVVRLDMTSVVMMANTMPGTRSEGSLCRITDVYIGYRSVDPGEWDLDVVILSGKREPVELGDEDYSIRVCQWSFGQIVKAPDWVRDMVADRTPSERIGE